MRNLFIVTTGAWSRALLAKTGITLSVFPVKGECFSVTTSVPLVKATIFSLGCYIVPKKGGRLVVGATVKPHTFDEKITVDGLSTLMNKAKKLLPAIANAERERAWAGICPLSADGLPFLDEHPHYQNLFIAAGHFRNGILLAPVTGIWMADLVEGKADRLAPFSFNRTQNLAQA